MKKIFEQVNLNNGCTTLKNRIVMSPMTTWASNDDYTVSEQELAYYAARNKDVGMVITGSANIDGKTGIGFTNQFGVYNDKFLPGLKKLAAIIKANGAKAVVQLNHAGSKALPQIIGEENEISASAVTTSKTMFVDSVTPREMTEEEIETVIKEFGTATKRVIEAGFDGVEIHGAHGFIIEQFLSPFFNRRTDKWGGSLKNRMRFAIEVFKEVQQVVSKYADDKFIIGWRTSPDEFNLEGGLRIADTDVLVNRLVEMGVSYIHASLPFAETAKPNGLPYETYVEHLSNLINGRTAFMAAGMIKDGNVAQNVLNDGADLVAVGQALVTDPDFVEKVKNGNDNKIEHALLKDNLKEISIPDGMWEFIKNANGWFDIK